MRYTLMISWSIICGFHGKELFKSADETLGYCILGLVVAYVLGTLIEALEYARAKRNAYYEQAIRDVANLR